MANESADELAAVLPAEFTRKLIADGFTQAEIEAALEYYWLREAIRQHFRDHLVDIREIARLSQMNRDADGRLTNGQGV